MCGSPQKAAAARFAAHRNEVLNKVIHRPADRVQFFSRIQNLAPLLKFYFNFERLIVDLMFITVQRRVALALPLSSAA
jgi:hypothetical protein